MSSGDAGSPSWSGARERIEALEGWAGLQRTCIVGADQFSDPVQPSGAFSFPEPKRGSGSIRGGFREWASRKSWPKRGSEMDRARLGAGATVLRLSKPTGLHCRVGALIDEAGSGGIAWMGRGSLAHSLLSFTRSIPTNTEANT